MAQDQSPNGDQPIIDVDKSTSRYLGKHPIYIILPLVAAAVIFIFVLLRTSNELSAAGSTIFCLTFLFLGSVSLARQRVQDQFMSEFATANGYAFSVSGGNFGALDGALFHLGNGNQTVRDTVSGQYLGCPISLFDYSYETGFGKNRVEHYYTVFQLQFNATMPDLLLEKKSFLSSDTLLGQLPEHVKLEGDFNKYFTLSIRKGYEVEALEVFTPDVMVELVEKCESLSLEIINNHLFIYDNKTVGTKADLYSLYDVARYFVQKLGPVLARMKQSTEAMEAVAQTQQTLGGYSTMHAAD